MSEYSKAVRKNAYQRGYAKGYAAGTAHFLEGYRDEPWARAYFALKHRPADDDSQLIEWVAREMFLRGIAYAKLEEPR